MPLTMPASPTRATGRASLDTLRPASASSGPEGGSGKGFRGHKHRRSHAISSDWARAGIPLPTVAPAPASATTVPSFPPLASPALSSSHTASTESLRDDEEAYHSRPGTSPSLTTATTTASAEGKKVGRRVSFCEEVAIIPRRLIDNGDDSMEIDIDYQYHADQYEEGVMEDSDDGLENMDLVKPFGFPSLPMPVNTPTPATVIVPPIAASTADGKGKKGHKKRDSMALLRSLASSASLSSFTSSSSTSVNGEGSKHKKRRSITSLLLLRRRSSGASRRSVSPLPEVRASAQPVVQNQVEGGFYSNAEAARSLVRGSNSPVPPPTLSIVPPTNFSIDLDAALGHLDAPAPPPSIPYGDNSNSNSNSFRRGHKRSESAPLLSAAGNASASAGRGQKRKMSVVAEEDEGTTTSTTGHTPFGSAAGLGLMMGLGVLTEEEPASPVVVSDEENAGSRPLARSQSFTAGEKVKVKDNNGLGIVDEKSKKKKGWMRSALGWPWMHMGLGGSKKEKGAASSPRV
ncbi:hypothetical protein G7K_6419-t1 [Saitoella complicata NRRL Y-17804]|uniref:Uncharacterized protein n=2 Tax=Saitoella complicata (strain BCRC 22490 / CBS 7301 / JCM 7358 / NBRC 10748 / NRRL Y-17804) TaxID=698492 RepID=A0A0E9NRM7_SAICN|nr:hypothetical protein G7K_6419-t1 [Saitoella complicata NRRL Y-17804]